MTFLTKHRQELAYFIERVAGNDPFEQSRGLAYFNLTEAVNDSLYQTRGLECPLLTLYG